MTRAPDFPFEALAEVTGTDWEAGRGELNKALASIREQSPDLDEYALVRAIRSNALKYRALFNEAALTPPALAKHWLRVKVETARTQATNQVASKNDECPTCDGDRFVVVATRQPHSVKWTKHEEQLGHSQYEEWAPCPDCNAQEIWFRRHDGTMFRTPDSARTRELMQR